MGKGKMKIGLLQINAVIGDFPGNAKRLLQGYRECLDRGADIVISPEMSLVGYPPRDLVCKSQFVPRALQALDYLASEIGEVPMLVGYIDELEADCVGKPFRNAAAFLANGEVQAKCWKSLLPTYDVFDEHRYFEPAEGPGIIEWAGKKIGVTICEDIWTDDYLERPYYRRDPVADLVEAGAGVIFNLSASPYHLGKPEQRTEMIESVSRSAGVPVVYCNSVGANDQLVFDGHSMVVMPEQGVVANLPGFVEQVGVVDFDDPAAAVCVEPLDDPAQLWHALVLGVRDYFGKTGFRTACLGLSGGIDSALTAAVAVEALGAENVHGLTLPSPYSSRGSVDDSLALAAKLGMRCDEVEIAGIFAAEKAAMQPFFAGMPEDETEENLQARTRGMLLMALSNKFNHLLLTTGNKSELAVGYCTIYGDMCGGLAVISDMPKTRVYEVCRWLNREREVIPWATIEKPPSAELRPDQKDQDTLPDYDVLDEILQSYVEQHLSADEIVAQGYDETVVRWVQRRVDLNEWKRQQAAPGIRVTSKAFGMGRRMPIVQRFTS